MLASPIGILLANIMRYRLVGNSNPHLVAYVGQVGGAGQLHLRSVSRASAFKLNRLGAGQSNLSMRTS